MEHDSYVRQTRQLNETIRANDADPAARERASESLSKLQEQHRRDQGR
jgi:hypothetical protein